MAMHDFQKKKKKRENIAFIAIFLLSYSYSIFISLIFPCISCISKLRSIFASRVLQKHICLQGHIVHIILFIEENLSRYYIA